MLIIIHADNCHGVGFNLRLYVSFSARYLNNRCSYRIMKLDIEMFHDESWKPIYFGVKGQRSRSEVVKNITGVGYSLAPTDDLNRFWRSKVKVGRPDCEGIGLHVYPRRRQSKSIF